MVSSLAGRRVQSSSGVTGRLTRERGLALSASAASLRGRSLGASGPGVPVPASARLAAASPRGSICQRRTGSCQTPASALCAPSGASAHTHDPRPSRRNHLLLEALPDGAAVKAGAPLVPPTHTPSPMFLSSSGSGSYARNLFPAGDNGYLPYGAWGYYRSCS